MMTPEQETVAMLEASMEAVIDLALANRLMKDGSLQYCHDLADDLAAIQEMPKDIRFGAALNKLYWLALDPDDMVH